MQHAVDDFRGRVALVTGAGRNVGRAIALAFARAGASVVVNGHRDQAALTDVAREISACGVECLDVLADVSDPLQVQAMMDQVLQRFGRIDISVSNVAVRPHQALLDISIEDWQRVLNTNLSAAFYLARSVIPSMQRQAWGRIIHISGKDAFLPGPGRAHNVAAKGGLHAFTKALAVEFGPSGITANTVAPGKLDTVRSKEDAARFKDEWARATASLPVRRLGTPEDIAQACLYIAGPGSFMTGQVLHLNGGDAMLG